ncbi:MAG: hypothetical protein ACYC09_09210 [Bacteroidota bacterium]
MKTQTVRQISTSTVPSRRVHEALVHSKKQAKRIVDPHAHTLSTGMTETPVEEKKTIPHLYDNARKMPHYSIVAFNQSSLDAAAAREFLPHNGPFSQYEVLKQQWNGYFLNPSHEITENSP